MARSRVEVRGLSGLIKNFEKFRDDLEKHEVFQANQRALSDVIDLAQQLCPVDTGRTQRAITGEVLPAGTTFVAFVDPAPYAEDGVPYYAPYVHDGTAHMAGRPFMLEAFLEMQPFYREDIRAAGRRAIARAG